MFNGNLEIFVTLLNMFLTNVLHKRLISSETRIATVTGIRAFVRMGTSMGNQS